MATAATQQPDPNKPPSYEDFQRDYWAPDREQVLAPGGAAPAPAPPAAPAPAVSAPASPLPNSGVSGYGTSGFLPGEPNPGTPYGNAVIGSSNIPSGQTSGYAAPAQTSNPWGAGSVGTVDANGNWVNDNGAALRALLPSAMTSPSPWQQTATPAGFDQTKWNDPTKSDPKYDVGHMVASGMSNDQIQQYLSQHDPGYNVTGKDIITDPQGNQFDFRFDQEGANKPMWEGVGGPGFQGGAPGGGGAAAGPGGAGGAGGAVGAAPQNSQFSDQVRQLLLQQLGSVTGPVTANDPAIKAEMDAQTAGADRLRRDQRSSDAERAAFQGLLNGGQSSGSFDQSVNNGFSQEQQQLAGVRADLFTREIQSRRQYAQGLLNQAIQSGDAESARQLQAYLAQLDNAYRYAALSQNQGQFNDTFGLQAGQFQYQKDRDLAQYGGGY